MAGRGKGGSQSGKLGGLTYVKQMPNFLAKFGGAQQEEGIEAALKKHAERGGDGADRSDSEDEQPQVVAMASAVARSDKEKQPTGKRADLFKQSDDASSKFADAAYLRVQQHEEKAARKEKDGAREPQPGGDGDASAATGKHVFKAGASSSSSAAKKRKAPPPQATAAAKVRNPSMLSFAEDGEDC